MKTLQFVLPVVALIGLLIFFIIRSIVRDKKNARDSYFHPLVLSIKDCGSILQVLEINETKIKLCFLRLIDNDKLVGDKEIDQLSPINTYHCWYQAACIPAEFHKIGCLVVPQYKDGKLDFAYYKGIIYKEAYVPYLGAEREKIIKLVEA